MAHGHFRYLKVLLECCKTYWDLKGYKTLPLALGKIFQSKEDNKKGELGQ